jgi:hypothetical protein
MSTSSPALLKQLAAVATIGTDRSRAALAPDALLHQAAVHGLQARAGFRPAPATATVPECPADPTPIASVAQTATLHQLLAHPDAPLILEWCRLAATKRVRVAPVLVPSLLDWWARQPNAPEPVFTVLGTHGPWLAALNPDWNRPAPHAHIPADADERWQTGTTPERTALLLAARRHDPACALELLRSTWSTDGADERRRFVEALTEQRSQADEPFLEAALDDKSKLVRRAAATLLALLPQSRLRARMNERARACIAVETTRGLLKRGPRVSLNPPAHFDQSWQRDAIEEPAGSGKGKRAWWLQQILSAADLSVWTETTGLEPAAVLQAIQADDFYEPAFHAIFDAASIRADASWCAALLDHMLASKNPVHGQLRALWRHLAPDQREPLVLAALAQKRFSVVDRWSLLASSDHPWSPSFSTKALALFQGTRPATQSSWALHEPIEHISRLVAPSCAQAFADTVAAMFAGEPTDSFKKSIDRAFLRQSMHTEFAA